jgi:GrpB-like predicted nucleotidyltransferase (UPF0157 family)
MGALKNPRWERFAQALVEGLANGCSQAKAYEAAGYSTRGHSSESAASRLLRNVEPVIRRVQELQAETAKRKAVTRDSIVDELETARELARENKQPSAMVAASATKAKVCGLFVEKIEQGAPGDFSSLNSVDEIADALLAQAYPHVHITGDMREAAINELQRHAAAIEAIANAESSSWKH